MKNTNTINYDAVSHLKSFLSPDVKILDLKVVGRYLKATLSSGVLFSVKNISFIKNGER